MPETITTPAGQTTQRIPAEEHGPASMRVVISPSHGLGNLGLSELWRYRELLAFIAWRDIKVRYKQTALGGAWAILQPLLMMLVFVAFVGRFAPKPSGVPYSIFAFAGLIPWTLFAQSLAGASQSLVLSTNLVTKVYFPRLILPLAAAGSYLLDFMLAFALLVVIMVVSGHVELSGAIVWLPAFTLLALLTAMAVGIWLSALNVRYRDFVHAVPFLITIWLFASPVAYSAAVVNGAWKTVYGLNPMAGVLEGFRWALIGTPAPAFGLLAASVAATLALLIGGLIYFAHTESTFADVI
jgi:lipopolysaccharide transport system permease protein